MNKYDTFTGCEHWFGAELDSEGSEYLVKEVNHHLQQFLNDSLHVAQYGTSLEFKEYMVEKLMELKEEFELYENDNT